MRRSSAPSAQSAAKRLRFLSPVISNSDDFQLEDNDFFTDPNYKPESSVSLSSFKKTEVNNDTSSSASFIHGGTEGNALRSTDEILKLISEPVIQVSSNLEVKNHLSISSFMTNRTKTCDKTIRSLKKTDDEKVKSENSHSSLTTYSHTAKGDEFCFNVMWCKRSAKKHKVWEGDGILIVSNRSAILKNMDGKVIDRGIGYKLKEIEMLEEGSKFYIGGKECEIQCIIPSEGNTTENNTSCESNKSNDNHNKKPKPAGTVNLTSSCFTVNTDRKFRPLPLKFKPPYEIKPENETLDTTKLLLMPVPTDEHQRMYNKKGLPVTDVKVDSFLANNLRPHQKDGIIFMYKCIMGFQHEFGQGVILADEMGLGKTLQCIALIWTLYKQGPYGGKPVLKNIIVITPSSLVTNWKKEFHKWLGESRLSVFTVDKKNTIKDYIKIPKPVLIISYEMFRRSANLLSSTSFDLVICDEGHRIKNLNIRISSVINCLSTTRRILLTGTPIQNDLAEYFSIVDFVNPGALGSIQSFRRTYERPIMQSRDQECTEEEKQFGEDRSDELNAMSMLFMLRRTQDVINQYLPPKSEVVIFCRPTELQTTLYKYLLNFGSFQNMLSGFSGHMDASLQLVYISILRKLCNHPSLLYENKNIEDNHILKDMQSAFPHNYVANPNDSGKMKVLTTILESIFSSPKKEKIVIVSGFTQTLNLIENLCISKQYLFLRLDGSTATSSRQDLVDVFNRSYTKYNIFLLSSKAGGVGFNLIGASRIVLYDIDWNPANDLQAMARIWRDGQKRSVFIYRLLTTGTIEEKIYQRQLSKQCLSGSVLNPSSNEKLKFSLDELKDLFTLHEDTECLTHDLIDCHCLKLGTEESDQEKENAPKISPHYLGMEELMNWKHIQGPISKEKIKDFTLTSEDITFLFLNDTHSVANI